MGKIGTIESVIVFFSDDALCIAGGLVVRGE